MDKVTIINLLTNSGIKVHGIDSGFIYFEDPTCIFPAFDIVLNYAWIVILILTAFMLTGWAFLYIKNGVNINNLFSNAKTIILIFCVLSVVKPAVNIVYGDNLFAKGCQEHKVALTEIQELLDMRNATLKNSDESSLYESLTIVDSGAKPYNPDEDEDDDDEDNESEENFTYDPEKHEEVIRRYLDTYASGTVDTESANMESAVSADSGSTTVYNENQYLPNQTNIVSATYNQHNGTVTYVTLDGSKIQRSKGTIAWRNNNPGNIVDSQFARSHGAVGSSGKFAIFPDEATGMNAIKTLLRSKSYNNLTIAAAINRWAPAADNNDPVKYAQTVSKLTGLSANRTISSLNDTELQSVANAIRKVEGWKPGQEQRI